MTIKHSARTKAWRLKRRAAGLCDRCGRPRKESAFRCDECGIKHRVKERERLDCTSWYVTGIGGRPKYEGEEL